MSETPTPYHAGTSAVLANVCNSNLKEAFEAGLAAAQPDTLIHGIFAHHKDIVFTDRREAALRERKDTEPGPKQVAGNIQCFDMDSLLFAIKSHKESRTAIFCDAENYAINAVFDFRERDLAGGQDNGWCQFTASMKLMQSRKLTEWKRTLTAMSQVDFANFLEDHLEDVVEPSGTHLLAIATDLEASSSGSFSGRVTLQNGNVALNYTDETKTTVEVPKEIMLGIPLFEHGPRYRLRARLRYQVAQGQVKFRLIFANLEDAIDHEFKGLVETLAKEFPELMVISGRLAHPW